MKVLLTGATGFIGRQIEARLIGEGIAVRSVIRRPTRTAGEAVLVDDIGRFAAWPRTMSDIETVIHTAARVHVMKESAANPLEEFRRVNVEGTMRLARAAAAANVRRFVFISSIKVNGESTARDTSFSSSDAPNPRDPYAQSKHEAEQALRRLEEESGMQVVVIRPPLVYGPGVKGNFLSMMRWLDRGIPLPLGAVSNARSLVSVDNLVDLISLCTSHPNAAGRTFLVSDGKDLSVTQLLERLAYALGTKARLIPVPPALLSAFASLVGRGDVARRVVGSLRVDIRETRLQLGWTPPVEIDAALARTAVHYRSGGSR